MLCIIAGAHTIGQARCTTFKQRLYNQTGKGQPDPTLNTAYLAQLKANCPASGGDQNLSPLDLVSPTTFDSQYFTNLKNGKGLLNSDQELYSTAGSSTTSVVNTFSGNQNAFFSAFTAAMIKMGNISPLTGTNGEID